MARPPTTSPSGCREGAAACSPRYDASREIAREEHRDLRDIDQGLYHRRLTPTRVVTLDHHDDDHARLVDRSRAIARREVMPDVWMVYVDSSAEAVYELNHPLSATPLVNRLLSTLTAGQSPFRVETTRSDHDDFGFVTRLRRAVQNGRIVTVELDYDHRPADGLLGLVSFSETCSQASSETSCAVTSRTWGAHGEPRITTHQPGDPLLEHRTELRYDSDGLVRQIETMTPTTAPRQRQMEYDSERLYVTRVTNALGHASNVVRHRGLGVPVLLSDANGASTWLRYDGFGRLRERQMPDGRTVSIAHTTGTGAMRVLTSANTGRESYVDIDAHGRPIARGRRIGGQWAYTEMTYDDFDKVHRISVPRFVGEPARWQSIERDLMGRVVEMSTADGVVRVSKSYAPLRTTVTDAEGHITEHRYSPNGELSQTIERRAAGDLTTSFTYGPFGRLSEVRDHLGDPIGRYAYNARGMRTELWDISAGTTTFEYNGYGELVGRTDAAGGIYAYAHDELGRLLVSHSPSGPTEFEWDTAPRPGGPPALGRLAHMTSPQGVTTTLHYDNLARQVGQDLDIAGTLLSSSQRFDGLGRLESVTYPESPGGGLRVAYGYDGDGMLSHIEDLDSGDELWRAETRSARGHITLEVFEDAERLERTFDPVTGELTGIESFRVLGAGARDLLAKHTYVYDRNGRITRHNESVEGRDEAYTYDALGRLSTWTLTESSTTSLYSYDDDDFGNLVASETPDGSRSYDHGERGHSDYVLTSIDGQPVEYDDRGRRTEDDRARYAYMSFNLPETIERGADITHFTYDALQRRVLKHDVTSGKQTLHLPGLYEQRRDGLTLSYTLGLPEGFALTFGFSWGISNSFPNLGTSLDLGDLPDTPIIGGTFDQERNTVMFTIDLDLLPPAPVAEE